MVWNNSLLTPRRFRALIRMPRDQRRLLVRALALTIVAQVGIRTLSVARLTGWLHHAARPGDSDTTLERVRWAVAAASRLVPGADRCLSRALAAQALLGRAGRPATLSIGFRRDAEGRATGHAWVESRGVVVVGGGDLESYAVLTPAKEGNR